MRPFEITLILSLPLSLIFIQKSRIVLLLPIAAAAAQLLLEGFRWQMFPAYTLAVFFLLAGLRPPEKWNALSIIGAGFLGILYLAAIGLPYLLPIPSPDAPDGPYPVGTQTFYLLDSSRADPFAPDPEAGRELMAQVWYPAGSTEGYQKAPWMQNASSAARAISQMLGLPAFTLDHLVYAETDSYAGAPVAEKPESFPVILFSHGYQGFRAQNTYQTQELASHGYIVVAVEHTYGSVLTIFPDGRAAPHNPETLPDEGDFEENFESLVSQWVADLVFTLDTLENGGTPFEPSLSRMADFSKVGALGHSTGGAAAIQFCSVDSRCASAMAMDPALSAVDDRLINEGYSKTLLNLYSESWASDRDNPELHNLLENAAAMVETYSINGTMHYDFSDLPSLSPLAHQFNLKGPIEGDRVLEIVNRLSLAFFNQSLKAEPSELLTTPEEEFTEVQVFRP